MNVKNGSQPPLIAFHIRSARLTDTVRTRTAEYLLSEALTLAWPYSRATQKRNGAGRIRNCFVCPRSAKSGQRADPWWMNSLRNARDLHRDSKRRQRSCSSRVGRHAGRQAVVVVVFSSRNGNVNKRFLGFRGVLPTWAQVYSGTPRSPVNRQRQPSKSVKVVSLSKANCLLACCKLSLVCWRLFACGNCGADLWVDVVYVRLFQWLDYTFIQLNVCTHFGGIRGSKSESLVTLLFKSVHSGNFCDLEYEPNMKCNNLCPIWKYLSQIFDNENFELYQPYRKLNDRNLLLAWNALILHYFDLLE